MPDVILDIGSLNRFLRLIQDDSSPVCGVKNLHCTFYFKKGMVYKGDICRKGSSFSRAITASKPQQRRPSTASQGNLPLADTRSQDRQFLNEHLQTVLTILENKRKSYILIIGAGCDNGAVSHQASEVERNAENYATSLKSIGNNREKEVKEEAKRSNFQRLVYDTIQGPDEVMQRFINLISQDDDGRLGVFTENWNRKIDEYLKENSRPLDNLYYICRNKFEVDPKSSEVWSVECGKFQDRERTEELYRKASRVDAIIVCGYAMDIGKPATHGAIVSFLHNSNSRIIVMDTKKWSGNKRRAMRKELDVFEKALDLLQQLQAALYRQPRECTIVDPRQEFISEIRRRLLAFSVHQLHKSPRVRLTDFSKSYDNNHCLRFSTLLLSLI